MPSEPAVPVSGFWNVIENWAVIIFDKPVEFLDFNPVNYSIKSEGMNWDVIAVSQPGPLRLRFFGGNPSSSPGPPFFIYTNTISDIGTVEGLPVEAFSVDPLLPGPP